MIYEISNNTLDGKKYLIEAIGHSEALEIYKLTRLKEIQRKSPELKTIKILGDNESILIKPIGLLIK